MGVFGVSLTTNSHKESLNKEKDVTISIKSQNNYKFSIAQDKSGLLAVMKNIIYSYRTYICISTYM